MLDLFSRYYSRTNRERLIAAGRVILAAFSLLAILVDVSEPSKNAVVAPALLIGYLGYAALVVTLIWRLPTCPRGLSLGTHAIDLVVFFALVYLTEGTTSPFFLLYFVFSIVCATLRWHFYGTAWTGLVAVVGFLAMGVFTQYVLHDPAFDLPHFIIRSVYLILLVVFIAYLGTYRWRLQRELFGLAAWPARFSTETTELLRELLQSSAATLRVSRVMMFWKERLTGAFHVATWSNGSFEWDSESAAASQPVIAEPLANTGFLCDDVRKPSPRVLYSGANGFNFWHGTPFNSEFHTQYAVDSGLLCALLLGEYLEGRIVFLDRRNMNSDDLVLAEIVTRMVAARMDNLYLLNQLQESAASDERIQLSHKLHDSLLQSLAVMGMQVEIITRLFQQNPDAAKDTLAKMREMLFEGSRNLRSMVAELKRTRSAAMTSASGAGNRGSGETTPQAVVRTRVA